MTSSRARLWTLGVAVAAMTLVSLPALAGQRGDGPRGPRGAHGRARQVLTQEQRDQIRPWLQAEREASKPLRDLHRQLRDAVLAETPDQGKIASLQSQIGSLHTEAMTRRTALAQRIAALLTPEQRKTFRDNPRLLPLLGPLGPGHEPFGPRGRGMRGRGAPDADGAL